MKTRRDILTIGGAALAGSAVALVATPSSTLAAPTSLDYQVNIADPSFGPVDTPANTTMTLQKGLDYCFGPITAPNGTGGVKSNKEAHIPNGNFLTNAPLQVKHLHGGRMIGAGRFVTKIENVTANSDVFRTNGCGYSHFEGFLLKANGTGRCFDLDWDGSAGGAALQSNTFVDMFFQGGGYGIEIGRTGFMGSENLFLNCFWIYCSVAGVRTSNWNALQQGIFGGNFQGCNRGILVVRGSVPVIHGVGFQQSAICDIDIQATARDSYSILGCRSESPNFVKCLTLPVTVDIASCSHLSSADGYFLNGANFISVRACQSIRGRIRAFKAAYFHITGVRFERGDWLELFELYTLLQHGTMGYVEVESSLFGTTPIFKRRITANDAFEYVVTRVTP